MHSLFYSPRHCKRRSGSILNLLMFYNLIKSAVLPKSICDMSFYYEQVWRVRNWGFDIDFKVTSFRLNSDIFKSQGLGCRILKFFVICPQGAKWLKLVILSVFLLGARAHYKLLMQVSMDTEINTFWSVKTPVSIMLKKCIQCKCMCMWLHVCAAE